jgi:hypothetical protein
MRTPRAPQHPETTIRLSPRVDAQTRQAVLLVTHGLDHGMITPHEAWTTIATLRQQGGARARLAEYLHDALQQWHDADLAHTQRLLARMGGVA